MADAIYAGSVLAAMQYKDPVLFGEVALLNPHAAMERWIEVYPEDFPRRGMTEVNDLSAIKPLSASGQDPRPMLNKAMASVYGAGYPKRSAG